MLTASEYRRLGREQLKGNWTVAILAVVIMYVITNALAATCLGIFVVAGPLNVGLCMIFLSVSRLKFAKIETMFEGFRINFAGNLLAYLLRGVYTFLWALLFIIPGLVKTYSYSMTMYLMADRPELSASEAIEESKKMMQGHKWELFCLDLSFIGWILLSILTFGILLLYVEPYINSARTVFYRSLLGEDVTAEQ